MSRHLYLLRHAKSDWSQEVSDFNRPLKKRGKKAAELLGQWMKQQGLIPDWIVSSPAVRAAKTAEGVCKGLNIEEDQIHFDEWIYEADIKALKQVLAGCPAKANHVLMVGHNPGFEELLTYLVKDVPVPDDGKLMATATLAELILPKDWANLPSQSGQLVRLIRASELKSD